MLDQLYGKPSSNWKRTQVFIVLLFWISRIALGNKKGPRLLFLRRLNSKLSSFTPYQIILSTLTCLYAIKHSDAVLGLQAPEPLARLYSKQYYRATWIVTALDAGFATAMGIKSKFMRDLLSIAFSGYYLFFANEADEKLRKYRAMCTVEMLRATWEKTTNPYIRFATKGDRPKVGIHKRILLPRPQGSSYTKPITAWIYFNGTELELALQQDLIFDIPGGGFICMTPEHHEERNLRWCIRTKKPVISLDYGKAPEYPFPFAIDEAYDAYKLLHETKGKCIGMSGLALNIVLSGDSAGANIGTALVIKILETRPRLPLPVSLVYAYAALSFHFTSWMPASDLKVLRQESSSNIAGVLRGKEHLDHRSPLSVVEDVVERPKHRRRSTASWGKSFAKAIATTTSIPTANVYGSEKSWRTNEDDTDDEREKEEEGGGGDKRNPLYWSLSTNDLRQAALQVKADLVGKKVAERMGKTGPLETRLAMTSRTAFFNDRIISPPMARAMALLYIGPLNSPDLHSDYHISPIFTPSSLLFQFPPVYMSCGERDPFVDDTVIFAGKLREAKETRRLELLGRENKFGESLRMSTGGSNARDPILDETEDDWVQMKVIEGWSHGYLQMVALLPEAVHAINMMADWISISFDKHHLKFPKKELPTFIPKISLPTPSTSPHRLPRSARGSIGGGATSESDKDDDVLSFTPRKRRGSSSTSRSGSPAPGANSSISSTREPSRSLSSSDETSHTSNSTDEINSPPSSLKTTPEEINSSFRPLFLPPPVSQPALVVNGNEAVAPHHRHHHHERALRDDLLASSLHIGSNGTSKRHQDSPPPLSITISDEDIVSTSNLDLAVPPIDKLRSPGSLPSNFVDAKDLLRRRREDAVWGISATNSTVPSDEEDENKKGKNEKKIMKGGK